jgi:hypothetical protein
MGAAGMVMLRNMNKIKTVQGVGRVVRLDLDDRLSLENKTIEVGKIEGWRKPFGYVILPVKGSDDYEGIERIKAVVRELRSEYHHVTSENIEISDEVLNNSSSNAEPDDLIQANLAKDSFEKNKLTRDKIDELCQEVSHDVEDLSRCIVLPTVRGYPRYAGVNGYKIDSFKDKINSGLIKSKSDWEDASYSYLEREAALLEVFASGLYLFLVASRMKYITVESILANKDIKVNLANHESTLIELMRLMCFDTVKDNLYSAKFCLGFLNLRKDIINQLLFDLSTELFMM